MKAMGIDAKKPEGWNCRTCKLAKAPKQISWETPTRSKEACAELNVDIFPHKPQGIGGFNYFMLIRDTVTMYGWLILLVRKNEAGRKLQNFIVWREKQPGRSVKVIITDGGKEFIPTLIKQFAAQKGIAIQESAPRTSEQNGKSEVYGKHLMDMSRSA